MPPPLRHRAARHGFDPAAASRNLQALQVFASRRTLTDFDAAQLSIVD